MGRIWLQGRIQLTGVRWNPSYWVWNYEHTSQPAGNQATHQFPDYRSWSLDWTAPSAGSGTVTFSLAVMAANGNGNNAGDGWQINSSVSEDSGSTNTPPTASSVSYTPSSPTKETGLGVSYTYYDEDGDFEQGTSIHWFRDGLRVTQIDDLTDIPPGFPKIELRVEVISMMK